MGEYSSLYIAGYEVDSWKNSIGEGAFLFAATDLIESDRPYDGEESTAEEANEGEDGDNEGLRGYQYRRTAGEIVDRLEIMGYTLERSRAVFVEGVAAILERSKENGPPYQPENGEVVELDPPYASHGYTAKLYLGYSFEVWSGIIKKVFQQRLPRIYRHLTDEEEQRYVCENDPQLHHVLKWSDYINFGYPGFSFDMYRGMLEVVPPEAPVVLDFSPLVNWTDPDDYTCAPPRIVIMTEGKSDKRILEGTLRILYPHLVPYYSFIDFDLANMPGSTGHLLNIVRAFVATGVQHRTIAVFDNDAAGHDALRQLSGVTLPDNIKVMALPSLPFASRYPTLGPQGTVEMDINGLACSLELYLGRDILDEERGALAPVLWTGLMQGAGRYQGEITDKAGIQDRYARLMERAENDIDSAHAHDWGGMRLVFKSIFDAFKDQPLFLPSPNFTLA
jgi:hypothetical protein